MDQQNGVFCFVVYSPKCLVCDHLVDGGPKHYNKCHYSNGNADCPALENRIISDGKTRQYRRRLDEAREAKDAKKVAAIWAEIEKEAPHVRQRLFDALI